MGQAIGNTRMNQWGSGALRRAGGAGEAPRGYGVGYRFVQ